MDKLIIIGINTTASNIYQVIKKYNSHNVIGFAVNAKYRTQNKFHDLPVFELETLKSKINPIETKLFIAVQWNKLNSDRKKLYETLKQEGFKFANIVAPSAIIHNESSIGENCWIADLVVIEPYCSIGNNTFIKTKVWVGHYSIIKEHCFIGACSVIAGNVTIKDQCFIGVNSTIIDNVQIGSKCIVGAGSLVINNLNSYSIIKPPKDHLVKKYDPQIIEDKLLANYNHDTQHSE